MSRLKKTVDDMQGTTFYEPNNAAHRSGTTFSLYLVKGKSGPYIRRIWRYRGSSWLFVRNIIVKLDGAEPQKFGAGWPTKEVVPGGGIVEERDVLLEAHEELFMALMARAKVVKIRFEGDNKYADHVLSAAEKQGIKDVLLARDALK